ncbi:hypothetical protein ACQJBY_059210 [Aegilops geniculata]
MYCKRMGLMLSEAVKAGSRTDEAKDEVADVTFSVSGALTAGMCDATKLFPQRPKKPDGVQGTTTTATTTATKSSPQQPKKPDGVHGTTATATSTATKSSPRQPKQPDGVHVTTTTAIATATELFPQQPKQPEGAKSGDPSVEVDHTNTVPGKKSDHINGSVHGNVNVHSNAKEEDSCSKVNIEQNSPRSPSYPFVNLTRRPGTLEDGPSFGLFEPGSDDDLLFQDPPQVSNSPARSSGLFDVDSFLEIRARSPLFDSSPGSSTGPVYDVTPLATYPPLSTGPAEAGVGETREEAEVIEVNSGQSHDGKKPTLKRAAPAAPSARKLQKMKKIKIDATEDAIYQRYCCTNYRIKDPPEGEPFPAFIRIGGFDISFKHFSNGLKKRAHLNNEVMSLYIESFSIEQTYNSTKPRKFAFSPHVATKLCVDPSSFKTSSCIRDLTRVCKKIDIVKFDQLFFTIVQREHWAVVVVNFMKKQFNVFDSRSLDPDYVSILEKPCCNLITNFKELVTEFNPWKQDFGTFQMSSPPSYPQQSTTYYFLYYSFVAFRNFTSCLGSFFIFLL